MKMPFFYFLSFFLLFFFPGAIGQSAFDRDSIISGQPIPKLVSRQFAFTEGPAVDRKGNIFFTDQPNNKIWEYDANGKLTLFMDSCGRSNGLYIASNDHIIACADENDELWSIGPDHKVKVLLKDIDGRRMNGPNDLWIDPAGGIYFTDPYYQRPYWNRTGPDIKGEKVYYLPKNKVRPIVVDSELVKPNGIVGTPDGKRLYVADIEANKTYCYRINGDGSLTDKKLFVELGSDGMTLDIRGNLYLTGNGVTVFDPSGMKIAFIPVPEKWTANLCFGGSKKNILFITASEAIYILPMRVKGVE
jgi:gluconolactonase